MSKKLLFAAFAAVALPLGFTACNDDDDEQLINNASDDMVFYEIQFDNWDGFEYEKPEAEAVFAEALGWDGNYGNIPGPVEQVANLAAGIFDSFDKNQDFLNAFLISSFDFKIVSLADGSTVYSHRYDRANRYIYGPFNLAEYGEVYYFSSDYLNIKSLINNSGCSIVAKVDASNTVKYWLQLSNDRGCFYPTGYENQPYRSCATSWLGVNYASVTYSLQGYIGLPGSYSTNGFENYVTQEAYDTLSLNSLEIGKTNYEVEINLSDEVRKNDITLTFAGIANDNYYDYDLHNSFGYTPRLAGLSENAAELPECHAIPEWFIKGGNIDLDRRISLYWHDSGILNTFKMNVNGVETTYTGCVNGQVLMGYRSYIYVNLKNTPLQGDLFVLGVENF